MTKYPYKYTIITKDGFTITNRMNAGKEVQATSQSQAQRVLMVLYPGCIVLSVQTTAKKHFDTSIGQMGSAIFL